MDRPLPAIVSLRGVTGENCDCIAFRGQITSSNGAKIVVRPVIDSIEIRGVRDGRAHIVFNGARGESCEFSVDLRAVDVFGINRSEIDEFQIAQILPQAQTSHSDATPLYLMAGAIAAAAALFALLRRR